MLRGLKQKLSMLTVGILAIAAILITSISCEKAPWSQQSDDSNYEISVASEMDAILNPMFSSVKEIKDFRNRLVDEYNTDVCFRSMPDDVLFNVSTVCLKKNTYVTKKDIVEEYRANSDVYNNLETNGPEKTNDAKKDTTVVEGQQLPAPSSISYHYEIDTINGRPVKTLIELRKYEQQE